MYSLFIYKYKEKEKEACVKQNRKKSICFISDQILRKTKKPS